MNSLWSSNKFMQSDHSSMIENMNHISNQLLKVYWYFLATIASAGISYYYLYTKTTLIDKGISSLIVWLTANIVFWKINEYAISHGFLFRYIQVKTARIEYMFYSHSRSLFQTIKDPSRTDKYIVEENGNLYFEYEPLLPDQFLPLYWSSIWMIILNQCVVLLLLHTYLSNSCSILLHEISIPLHKILSALHLSAIISRLCATINCLHLNSQFLFLLAFTTITSLIFIGKIFTYHLIKINKFFTEFCDFEIKYQLCYKKESMNFFYPGNLIRIFMPLLVAFGIILHILKFLGIVCKKIHINSHPQQRSVFIAQKAICRPFHLVNIVV